MQKKVVYRKKWQIKTRFIPSFYRVLAGQKVLCHLKESLSNDLLNLRAFGVGLFPKLSDEINLSCLVDYLSSHQIPYYVADHLKKEE